MKGKWLGHASMLLTSRDGVKVVTAPYEAGAFSLNYAPIDVEADIVTVSHDHPDHNNVFGVCSIGWHIKHSAFGKSRGSDPEGACYE